MPFEDGVFEAVVSNDTLHVVPGPVAMLNECERVLSPGGVLVVRCIRRCWLAVVEGVFRTAYTPAEAAEFCRQSRLRPWRVRKEFMTLAIEAAPAR